MKNAVGAHVNKKWTGSGISNAKKEEMERSEE